MKVSELKRWLRRAGCRLYRQGTRHEIWINPENGRKTEINRHSTLEVKEKTLQSIKRDLFGQ